MDLRYRINLLDHRYCCGLHCPRPWCFPRRQNGQRHLLGHLPDQLSNLRFGSDSIALAWSSSVCLHLLDSESLLCSLCHVSNKPQNLGYLVAASIGFTRVTIITPSGFLDLFASAWAWPCVLLVGMFLIPESPFHLVRHGQLEKAEKALHILYGKNTDVKPTLNNIYALTEAEKSSAHEAASASFLECFRGTNWRRTRIILYSNAINNMVGIPIVSNGPYFMVQAGLSPAKVSMMIEIGIAFGMVSSLYTFYFLTKYSRRKIIFVSTTVAAAFLLTMGIAGCFPHNTSAQWTVGISLQLLWFCISSSVGPAMATAGEISSARLRAKSQAIGLGFNYLWSCVWNVVTPYMFNPPPTGGGLLGKTGFIFCATSVISIVVFYFEFPDTKDRTFVELDEMFERKVKTREFRKYTTHGFEGVGR